MRRYDLDRTQREQDRRQREKRQRIERLRKRQREIAAKLRRAEMEVVDE
jgi:hypothetical protein